MTLFICLGIILLIAISIQIVLRRIRGRDKNSINEDWKKFLHASSKNNIGEIKYYGDKLIWNKYLKQNQLTKISEVVAIKIEKYPELEKLKLDAYNKQLHYNRLFPGSGSSGGIKQSWSE